MRRRPLGKTGLRVTELALGTWGLSGDGYGPVTEMEQELVIERARAVGIRLFDTADSYAHGAMERRLGARLGKDETALIVTRIGTDRDHPIPRKRFDVEFLRAAFDGCRERLGRDVLDVVLLHNPSTATLEAGHATGLMSELVSTGKLTAWGASVGSVDAGRAALGRGAQVLSLPYNVFHQTDFIDLGDELERHEAGVLAHSALAYGLLCGHWSADKIFPDFDHRSERWTGDELRRRVRQLDAVRPLVGGPVASLRAAALRFVLSNERIASCAIGPRSTLQLDQLVREAGREPPYFADGKLTALRNRLRDVGVPA
ncbi:MAG: aldo/keto reductase [Sorangiineae bacterium]|nr:aldo/keto reductase [Polyangiaceae bacterium]MEB2323450.1 aldo/keto reductase [Sorangiineae bacterium]